MFEKKKLLGMIGKFMAFMLLCTLISRGVYANNIPRVKTVFPENINLSHTVEAEGSVKEQTEVAVTTLPGIRIGEICVRENMTVQKGDKLLVLDMEDLKEQIDQQAYGIKSLELQIQDLRQNKLLEQQTREQAMERAALDRARAEGITTDDLAEADSNLLAAKKEQAQLSPQDDFINNIQNGDLQLKALQQQVEKLKRELADLKKQGGSASGNDGTQDIQNKIRQKQIEIEDAVKAADNQIAAIRAQALADWRAKKAAAEETVKTEERKRKESLEEKNQEILEAERKLEDAMAVQAVDSSLERALLEKEQKEKQAAKYHKLFQQEGAILSPASGLLTKIPVKAGENTPEGPLLWLATMGDTLTFGAFLTEEEQKYVSVGDTVAVSFQNGNLTYEEAQVTAMEESGEGMSQWEVLVTVPAKDLTIGEAGTLNAVRKSAEKNLCIPLEALRSDSFQDYVLIASGKETVFGEEMYAERKEVRILDKNDSYAAIEPGYLEESQRVIVSSTDYVDWGDVIRPEEE